MSKRNQLVRKLRHLVVAGEISESEYKKLVQAGSKKKVSRKQRETALRNLRRACASLDKKKASSKGSSRRTKLEREVDRLQSDLRAKVRNEQLKEKKKRLKEDLREFRNQAKAQRQNVEGFLF